MSIQPLALTEQHLQLAVLRLLDVCVHVQDDLYGYLGTAALETSPRILPTLEWLRRRNVDVCLLSDLGEADTATVLARLGWAVGEGQTVRYLICEQGRQDNPVVSAARLAGNLDPNAVFTVGDTPRLLHASHAAGAYFTLGVSSGRSPYHLLATAPHHMLLDQVMQLPNFLLSHLPEVPPEQVHQRPRSWSGLPLLWLPRPLA